MTDKTAPSEGDKDGGETTAGTALATVPGRGVDSFVSSAQEAAAPKRGLGARLLDYSAHAAIIVGLIGVAWTVSSHLGLKPTAAQIESPAPSVKTAAVPAKLMPAAPAEADAPGADSKKAGAPKPDITKSDAAAKAPSPAAKPDELAELRRSNAEMAADIKSLRANLDTLRASVRQDKTSGEVRALQADLKSVKSGLDTTRTETDAALAQLSGQVDKLQHATPAPPSKMQQLVDRLGRLERGAPIDTTTTGSIDKDEVGPRDEPGHKEAVAKPVPTPPTKPASVKVASAEEPRKDTKDAHDDAAKPQVLSGWVVRDVYDGVALIEGKRGPMEVVPGVSIPGAGVVKSIDRHGNGWTVTTSKGQLAYAAPPHDYRRVNPHEFYPPPYADY